MTLQKLLSNTLADVRETQRNLGKLFTIGKILSVNLEDSTVTVKIKNKSDGTDLTSPSMKWLSPRLSNGGVIWANPQVGDRVIVLSLTGNLNTAYAIPFIAQADDKPDDFENANKTHFIFDDTRSMIVDDTDGIVLTNDDTQVIIEDGSITLTCGSIVVPIKIEMTSTAITLTAGAVTATFNSVTGAIAFASTSFTWNGQVVVVI